MSIEQVDQVGTRFGDPGERPQVVLFGPPGALVSEVAQALADRLHVDLLDSDRLIEERTGRPVADILIQDGEAAYRALEHAVAEQSLRRSGVVVALGGGAPLQETIAERLTQLAGAGAVVAELGVSVGCAAKRLQLNLGVPTALINPRAQWMAQQKAREPRYARIRTHLVPTDYIEATEIARRIARLIDGAEHTDDTD